MQNMIWTISGYMIVLSFLAVALIVRRLNPKKEIYTTSTISGQGVYPKIRPVISSGCIIIALLGLPFMYGLDLRFGVFSSLSTVLFGVLASITLIFTGFTVGQPDSLEHYAISGVFMVSLLLYGFCISLLVLSYSKALALSMIMVIAANALLSSASIIRCFIHRQKPNGIIEITYLGLNSIWIVLYATAISA